jgi:hypothetical protein
VSVPESRDISTNGWVRALIVWTSVLIAIFVWWNVDAGNCSARVNAECATGPCGPDAGWACGLSGAFLMMAWMGVLVIGAAVGGLVFLASAVRGNRNDGQENRDRDR